MARKAKAAAKAQAYPRGRCAEWHERHPGEPGPPPPCWWIYEIEANRLGVKSVLERARREVRVRFAPHANCTDAPVVDGRPMPTVCLGCALLAVARPDTVESHWAAMVVERAVRPVGMPDWCKPLLFAGPEYDRPFFFNADVTDGVATRDGATRALDAAIASLEAP